MAILRAIGLMSGTSMDGIDVAAIRSDGHTVHERGPALFVPYEAEFRRRIEQALEPAKTIVARDERPGDLGALEREITGRHAQAVRRFVAEAPPDWREADVVGFHGQTVLHRPAQALTVQLGDGAALSRAIGFPVVYDMRANDMTQGGQGAPLVPAYHAALARSLPQPFSGRYPVAYVNVGGIANVTYVPETGDPIAFDTGPGNTLIDQWVAREAGVPYDSGGAIGSEGQVAPLVVARYLANPFFARTGPKSLDRNDFTLAEVDRLELSDGARTLAAVTARSIMMAATHMPRQPALWVVCGGGRKNRTIVADMRVLAEARGSEVVLAEDVGLDGDAAEAEAWAFLAIRALGRLPLTFPTTTGCRQPVSGGVIAKP